MTVVKEKHTDVFISSRGGFTYVNLCNSRKLSERSCIESRVADKAPLTDIHMDSLKVWATVRKSNSVRC